MDYNEQLKIAQNYQARKATEKLALAKQLGTTKGFYNFYFTHLPKFQSQQHCFYSINELHYNIFSEYKYTNYNSFRKRLKEFLFAEAKLKHHE